MEWGLLWTRSSIIDMRYRPADSIPRLVTSFMQWMTTEESLVIHWADKGQTGRGCAMGVGSHEERQSYRSQLGKFD